MLRRFNLLPVVVVLFSSALVARAGETAQTLLEARKGHETKLIQKWYVGEEPPVPPNGVLDLTKYESPLGTMAAYVSPDPKDDKRHPAVIWLVGGFSSSISSIAWTPGDWKNDQSASGFRSHGIIMMYPSLRGGNKNPGVLEACYGEVDDVLAAVNHLASLPYVDPKRIYLGGHSTGGTLALLVAETGTTAFRAVFSLGPVGNVAGYGQEELPFDVRDITEGRLRAPIAWLPAVARPTFVFEGADPEGSNIGELHRMSARNTNPNIHFYPIPGASHFTLIAPLLEKIATQIATDTGDSPSFDFSSVDKLMTERTAKE